MRTCILFCNKVYTNNNNNVLYKIAYSYVQAHLVILNIELRCKMNKGSTLGISHILLWCVPMGIILSLLQDIYNLPIIASVPQHF